MKNGTHLKMYVLLNMVIVHGLVSFFGGVMVKFQTLGDYNLVGKNKFKLLYYFMVFLAE